MSDKREEAHRIAVGLEKAAKEYPEVNVICDAFMVANKRMAVIDRAFEMACKLLHKYCLESETCIFECPYDGTEICQEGAPAPVDWGSYLVHEAALSVQNEQSEDGNND